ncbi:ATP-dependent DNA helicase [Trichonephila clavipes]|nr:ATP-dependent DNA helicase [Trichonephila clavipes]
MEKLRPNQIDEIISAEIPNLETDRKLYVTVTKNMIHGPCGALNPSSPCMKEGKCTKKYPRGLSKDTKTNDKGYPLYRRRAPEDGGHTLAQKTRVDGQEFETFRQVCEKLGLLEDDNHWDATMEEAILCRSLSQIRELFAILICTFGLSNPLQLWDKYKVALSEDILHRFEKMDQINNDLCLNEALIHIEDKIIMISGKKSSDFGMPTPQRRGELSTNLIKELSYNIVLLDTQVSETEPCLLPEQKDIYNKILQRVDLAKIRKDRNVALAVASSGIAATLLSSGRTAHSVFKLTLNLTSEEIPTCNITKNSARSTLLQQCKLIVWDEGTMSHKRAIEALDRCLQGSQNNPKLMGGVVVLLAEDFRQTLPVIERGTAADEINACLKASYL